jgi:hypothetical protein
MSAPNWHRQFAARFDQERQQLARHGRIGHSGISIGVRRR